MTPLRSISLTIVEPAPGFFYWQILELSAPDTGVWAELQRSKSAYREWIEAFNGGVDQVFSYTKDGRIGPRCP